MYACMQKVVKDQFYFDTDPNVENSKVLKARPFASLTE